MRFAIFSALFLSLVAQSQPARVSGDEVLAKLAERYASRRALLQEYSGLRRYAIKNSRFNLRGTATVRMTCAEGQGKRFTVLSRSGSEKLNGIVDKVLEAEAGASHASVEARYQITPANYFVNVRAAETIAGRPSYVLELTPRKKDKYLIRGKVWIDSGTYSIVRLDGRFASSLSWWIGEPRITEEFQEVAGFWMPVHTRCESSTMILGSSELDVVYTDYEVHRRDDFSARSFFPLTGGPGDLFRAR